MADNVAITPGSGNTVGADEVTDGVLGTVKVQYVKLMDGTIDSTNKLVVNPDGSLNVKLETQSIEIGKVDQGTAGTLAGAWPVELSDGTNLIGVSAHPVRTDPTGTTSQPVTGTFFQTTQPVSGSISVSNFPVTQPISGSVTAVQSTGTNLHVVVDTAPSTVVTGTVSVSNFPATQPISATSLPLPTGASTSANQTTANSALSTIATNTMNSGTPVVSGTVAVNNFPASQAVSLASTTITGTVAVTQSTTPWNILDTPATLCISTTAATGVGVTATLPAVAGQFHYITGIIITKYFTVANAASATPLVVTTTNLPGALAISFGQPLGTVGTVDVRSEDLATPLKSSTVNTATTVVCPATTGIIWRVNVFYYVAS